MVKRGIVPQCAVPFRAPGRPGSRSDRPGKVRGTRACEAPVPWQAVCRRCCEERRITPGSRRGGTGWSLLAAAIACCGPVSSVRPRTGPASTRRRATRTWWRRSTGHAGPGAAGAFRDDLAAILDREVDLPTASPKDRHFLAGISECRGVVCEAGFQGLPGGSQPKLAKRSRPVPREPDSKAFRPPCRQRQSGINPGIIVAKDRAPLAGRR